LDRSGAPRPYSIFDAGARALGAPWRNWPAAWGTKQNGKAGDIGVSDSALKLLRSDQGEESIMPDPSLHNVLIQAALAGIAVKACVAPAKQRIRTGACAPFPSMGASAAQPASLRFQDTAGARPAMPARTRASE
jgi:hypothetical protein